MDLHFTSEEEAFRAEVRAFLARELPDEIRRAAATGRMPPKEMMQRWTRILHARGWSTPQWPTQYGGPGFSTVQRYIFGEELQQAPAPAPLPFGVSMVGPVIYTFGNDAQKQQFLPRIATLEDWWCQGFSEPGAGSDLASLRTRAERQTLSDGDYYIVNGQKTWTSYAQYANWIFVLARTDIHAKKQQGISFLLIDMQTPGITVRPLITLEGGHEINEVFFDNVRVPVANRVGEENKGWDYAKFLLGNERISIARVGTSKERIRRIKQLAAVERDGAATLLDNPSFRTRLAALEVELQALEITQLRVLASAAKRAADQPDPANSILKIKGSEIQQTTTELMLELAGPLGLPYSGADGFDQGEKQVPDWAALAMPTYFNWRKVSIYGGANEIQKSIIAKAVLGL